MKTLNLRQLEASEACWPGRNFWTNNFGTDDVPITQEVVDKVLETVPPWVSWFAARVNTVAWRRVTRDSDSDEQALNDRYNDMFYEDYVREAENLRMDYYRECAAIVLKWAASDAPDLPIG